MLAYLFWHRPREGAPAGDYEQALETFHRSLARQPPAGMCALASYRLTELPWRTHDTPGGPFYEDWYLVADYASLGVLNEAAAGRGHRSRHDEVASRAGPGAGGLYALLEGEAGAAALATAGVAVWVSPQPQASAAAPAREPGPAELLGDGMDAATSSLWRRQLVLGPAPEFCLAAPEPPPGVREGRLPHGWSSRVLEREQLWSL